MRAVIAETLESLDSYTLKETGDPVPAAGQVLVRVAACGVGYVDALVALGRYQVKPKLPHIPGQEIAGVVEAVGEGVTGFSTGDRVLAMTQQHGGFAELALAPAAMTFAMPDAMSFAQGACFPINYLTVMHGLRDRARLMRGERMLVLGAAGGVGSAAVQVGKAMGASVIAAASSPEKRDFALAQGADAAIDVEPEGWRDRLKEACGGKGPDVVFDPVCGPLFEPAFRSLAWGGRHLVIGFVGGPIPKLAVNLPLMKGAALVGVDVRQYREYEAGRAMDDIAALLRWAGAGRINPAVGPAYRLTAYGDALNAAFSGRPSGKVVLQVANP